MPNVPAGQQLAYPPLTGLFSNPRSADVPFSPLDITGLGLWLDAADADTYTLDVANVDQWDDKSGGDNHAVKITDARRPNRIDTGSGVFATEFIASTDDTFTILAADGPDNVFAGGGYLAVALLVDSTNTDAFSGFLTKVKWNLSLIDSASTYRMRFLVSLTTGIEMLTSAADDIPADAKFIFELTYDSDDVDTLPIMKVNGAALSVSLEQSGGIGTYEDDAALAMQVGAIADLDRQFDGNIHEILLYNGLPSSDDQTIVREYLADRWSITLP